MLNVTKSFCGYPIDLSGIVETLTSKMVKSCFILSIFIYSILSFNSFSLGADSNTVSSTVVTDKTPPTASAPSVIINNNDVCKLGMSGAAQAAFLGIAAGISVTDENCERIKLARSLFGMGMKVAAVSLLCQDKRVFEAMEMAGTPCPYRGKTGDEALKEWNRHGAAAAPKKPKIDIVRLNKGETQYTPEQSEFIADAKRFLNGFKITPDECANKELSGKMLEYCVNHDQGK